MTQVLQLTVPHDYVLDSWFADAAPAEVGLVLDLASRLPRIVGDEKHDLASKLYAARTDGTDAAVRAVLNEASARAEASLRNELSALQQRVDAATSERDALQELVREHERALASNAQAKAAMESAHALHLRDVEATLHDEKTRLVAQHEHSLLQKDHELKLELTRIKTMEAHLEETTSIKLDALRRELTVDAVQQLQAVREQHVTAVAETERLRDDLQHRVTNARQEEVHLAAERAQEAERKHAATVDALQLAKHEAETKLFEAMTQKCAFAEQMHLLRADHASDVAALKDEIADLRNPLGRGNAGEFDVAQTLRDLGYHVEDTSEGERKTAGFLDLLVQPDDSSGENMRIAVEIKNKKTIKKASDDKARRRDKDIDDDVRTFQQRVRDGIQGGLFDAALFVSIRAHTKMGAPVVLEMFEDGTGRPLTPVAYIGPERAKHALPLTQEQLETQMGMMFCVLEQCHAIRSTVCNGLKDEEIGSFQALFDEMGSFLNATFAELRRQEQLLREMTANLTQIRCRCIRMFRSTYRLNGQIPWLQRKLQGGEWISVFETCKEKARTMKDSDVWNKMPKLKGIIEGSIGKDAMLQVIRAEQDAEEGKEEKEEKEEEGTEEEAGPSTKRPREE